MLDFFDATTTQALQARIDQLDPARPPQWGKMNAAQMLAHCSVAFDQIHHPERHQKPGALMGWVLRTFIKKNLVNEVAYKKNSPTAPTFIVNDERDFTQEKARLLAFIHQTQAMGAAAFANRPSLALGTLSSQEWSNLLYKHLDHHLVQFGV